MRSTLSGLEVELAQWLKPFLDRLGHKARRRMCPLPIAEGLGTASTLHSSDQRGPFLLCIYRWGVLGRMPFHLAIPIMFWRNAISAGGVDL